MKLTVGYNEISITVKNTLYGDEMTKAEATKRFLNELACLYFTEARDCEKNGFKYAAEGNRDKATQIYDFLDALHYFDSYKVK